MYMYMYMWEALAQIGLHINYDKSCAVASPETISKLPPQHLLGPLANFRRTTHT